MTIDNPLGPAFYFRLGMAFSAVFLLVSIAAQTWVNAILLVLLFVAFAVGGVLVNRGRQRTAMHVVVAAMLVHQFVVLYLYRDTPNIGLIWFLIVPSIVASMGRPVDIVIWTPVCLAAMLVSYLHVRADPAMGHPLTVANIVGAISFMAIVSYRFVSERLAREQQLTQALELAQQAEQRTTRFLASLSHELRSPMTGIVLSAEMLKDNDSFSEADQASIERLNRSAVIAADLLNDVLALAKFEAGVVRLERGPFRIEQLMADIRTALSPLADDQGLALDIYLPPDCPSDWDSSATCLQQILGNLIGNGIRYSQSGGVVVSAVASEDFLDFFVTDTGSGIEDDEQARIFDPFISLSEISSAGTGLGLTLARGYAQLLNCELDLVYSEVGVGSQFRLRVPSSQYGDAVVGDAYVGYRRDKLEAKIELASEASREWVNHWLSFWGISVSENAERVIRQTHHGNIERLARDLDLGLQQPSKDPERVDPGDHHQAGSDWSRRCLVCDDNDLIREVFALQLKKMGYEVTTASDRQETMAQLEAGSVSFLLLDVQLGDESGVELLAEIRASDQPYRDIPVCMISGSLMAKEEAIALGADEYLLKPPKSSDLSDAASRMSLLSLERTSVQTSHA